MRSSSPFSSVKKPVTDCLGLYSGSTSSRRYWWRAVPTEHVVNTVLIAVFRLGAHLRAVVVDEGRIAGLAVREAVVAGNIQNHRLDIDRVVISIICAVQAAGSRYELPCRKCQKHRRLRSPRRPGL